MDAYIRAVIFLSRVAGVFAAVLIGLAVFVICEMVIERYFLNVPTIWQIDVVTYRIVAATFVGSAYVLMTRGHVNVEILPLYLGPRARYLARAVHHRAGARPSAWCCSFSARSIGIRPGTEGWHSNTVWRARLWIPYLSMPIGLGLLVLQYIAELLCLVTGRALPFGLKPKEDARGVRARPGQASLGRRAVSPTTSRVHSSSSSTLLMLLSGIPVAFGLGAISIIFLLIFHGIDSMHVVAETFWSGLDEFTLVAIPMFVMMGAAIGSSPAGKDLYEALDRWLYRLPGGLVISNLGACAIFAALTGSSPACCAAIGKMGIPEMRRRGYPDDVATGSICAGGTLGILIPPSITFILYGIATETSIGRLFLAGVMPGLMLTGLFMVWTIFIIWKRGFRSHAIDFRYSWKEKFQSIPKIAPFLLIIFGVMYSLYGGVATPSEAAGVGAALCLILAVLIYRLWKVEQIWHILRDTMRESVMILTIIAAAVLFGYMLTSLYLTQTLAQAIADAHFNRWVLMGMINLFLLVCGFFIPPAAIILMTSPILLPIITAAGLRSGLVRRHPDHQHGNRPDPSAGRPQHLHRQCHRARRAGHHGHVGNAALRHLYDVGDRDLVLSFPKSPHGCRTI